MEQFRVMIQQAKQRVKKAFIGLLNLAQLHIEFQKLCIIMESYGSLVSNSKNHYSFGAFKNKF